MTRVAGSVRRALVTVGTLACAASFAGCPLGSDGEKKPNGGSLSFESAASLATDGTYLFLTEAGEDGFGAVKRVDLSGPKATTIVADLANPTCILAAGNTVFWLEDNDAPDGAVRSAGIDGSGATTLAESLDSPHAIALNATHLFFADRRGGVSAVNRVPRDGGTVETLATLPSDFATTLVADDAWVYFTLPYDAPGGSIGRVPAGGGPAETFVSGLGTPTAMTLAGNRLCFTEFMGSRVSCVEDVSTGSTPTLLATEDHMLGFGSCPGLILAEAGPVYYVAQLSATQDAVRMVLPGNAPVNKGTTDMFGRIRAMVFLDTHIYWLEHDALYRIDKF